MKFSAGVGTRTEKSSFSKLITQPSPANYQLFEDNFLPSCLHLLPSFRSSERCPQLGGCRPFPRSESSIERIRILVAEQVCHLCDIDIRPVEILARQFLPRLQKQLPESCPVVDRSASARSDRSAQAHAPRPRLGTGPGQQAFKNPFHLLADRTLRTLLFKSAVRVADPAFQATRHCG